MEVAIDKLRLQSEKESAPVKKVVEYLIEHLNKEPVFADKVNYEKKSVKEMMEYIYSEAVKLASRDNPGAFLDDSTVYGWAVHYFDEENLEFEKVKVRVDTSSNNAMPKVESKKEVSKPKVKQKKVDEFNMNIFDFMGDEKESYEEESV